MHVIGQLSIDYKTQTEFKKCIFSAACGGTCELQ